MNVLLNKNGLFTIGIDIFETHQEAEMFDFKCHSSLTIENEMIFEYVSDRNVLDSIDEHALSYIMTLPSLLQRFHDYIFSQ